VTEEGEESVGRNVPNSSDASIAEDVFVVVPKTLLNFPIVFLQFY
jgi:hypothetical protein